MGAIEQFLVMGGYARFVWPAYGMAALTLAAMAIWFLCAWRRRERAWNAVSSLPRRRER